MSRLSCLEAYLRRGGRAAEGAPLLREYGLIPHRGFESLPLRQYNRFFWYRRARSSARQQRLATN